jgi:hypothetical protein
MAATRATLARRVEPLGLEQPLEGTLVARPALALPCRLPACRSARPPSPGRPATERECRPPALGRANRPAPGLSAAADMLGQVGLDGRIVGRGLAGRERLAGRPEACRKYDAGRQ